MSDLLPKDPSSPDWEVGKIPSVFVVTIYNAADLRVVKIPIVFASKELAIAWTGEPQVRDSILDEDDYFCIIQVEYRSHQ